MPVLYLKNNFYQNTWYKTRSLFFKNKKPWQPWASKASKRAWNWSRMRYGERRIVSPRSYRRLLLEVFLHICLLLSLWINSVCCIDTFKKALYRSNHPFILRASWRAEECVYRMRKSDWQFIQQRHGWYSCEGLALFRPPGAIINDI